MVGSWAGVVHTAGGDVRVEFDIAASGDVRSRIGAQSDSGRARVSAQYANRLLLRVPGDLEAVRVLVTDLPPGVTVYNRSGLTNEIPYVLHNLPVAAGGSIDLVIEYYVPNRVPPNPTLLAEVVRSAAPFGDVPGEMEPITRQVRLANGTFMLEWSSQRHRTYFIQYSEDLMNWKTVVPAAIGTGTRQQWIDNGPPKTDAFPVDTVCRFYRLILAQ